MTPNTRPPGTESALTAARGGPLWPHVLAGLVAVWAGVVAGHVVAALVDPARSPVTLIGSRVVDATPTPVKEWAIRTFGTADKAILVGGVVMVTLLVAVLLGLVGRRRPGVAVAGFVLVGALPVLAAATVVTASPFGLLPALVTLLVGVASYLILRRALPAPAVAGGAGVDAGQPGRRTFLVLGAGLAAAAAGGMAVANRLNEVPGRIAALVLPKPRSPAPPLPAGIERTITGVSSFRTPVDSFYRIDTALVVPRVDPDTWQLQIDGDVDRPFTLRLEDVLRTPMIERHITLTCVSNEVGGEYVGAATWLGVPVRTLLARAGVRAGVDQILSTDVQGMTISTPLQALTDGRAALLAVGMNGAPLPAEHGFPARLVTPGLYGFVGSTKWVTRLTATTYGAQQAYWTRRGWATEAPVLTQSRIELPRAFAQVPAGRPAYIGGVAWAQGRGVRAVEVRVDDGPWTTATLGPDAGVDYWRQWYVRWTPASGRHTLRVRATDRSGATQPETSADPFPSGATGWHSLLVNAV